MPNVVMLSVTLLTEVALVVLLLLLLKLKNCDSQFF
jgi:hypothetical protein